MGGKRFYLNVEFFPPSCWFLYAKEEFGGSLRAVSVWSDRWLPAAAWRLLWSRSVSLSVEVVLRYVRRTTDWGLFPSSLSHAHRRKQDREHPKTAGCFLKARVQSAKYWKCLWFIFSVCWRHNVAFRKASPTPRFCSFHWGYSTPIRVNDLIRATLQQTRCSLDKCKRLAFFLVSTGFFYLQKKFFFNWSWPKVNSA